MSPRLDELFEYLFDTRRTAEELVDQVNSLIEDAELVHNRVEDILQKETFAIRTLYRFAKRRPPQYLWTFAAQCVTHANL
jgi:hypothetical protein